MRVCLSGKMLFTRYVTEAHLTSCGFTVDQQVTPLTAYLVMGEKPSVVKVTRAQDYNLPAAITEREFWTRFFWPYMASARKPTSGGFFGVMPPLADMWIHSPASKSELRKAGMRFLDALEFPKYHWINVWYPLLRGRLHNWQGIDFVDLHDAIPFELTGYTQPSMVVEYLRKVDSLFRAQQPATVLEVPNSGKEVDEGGTLIDF